MMNPKEIMRFIEKNELGYVLGNAVRSIILAKEDNNKKLQHLKDARLFLNDEIKRLSKKITKT